MRIPLVRLIMASAVIGFYLSTAIFASIIIDNNGSDLQDICDFVDGDSGLLVINSDEPEGRVISCDPDIGLALSYITPFAILFFGLALIMLWALALLLARRRLIRVALERRR